MKKLFNVLFVAFVLSLVPAANACAQWKDAGNFSEGLAGVMDANEKWGFIDKTGKVVISCQWKGARDFHEGLALVKDANEKWGFIDKTGKILK